jgi:transcriptional repressor NrdR
LEAIGFWVVKKDGRREAFDGRKLFEGIRKACAKRPVPTEVIDNLVAEIESELLRQGRSEVSGQDIGELVMARLREIEESLVDEIEEYRAWKKNAEVLRHQLSLMSME